MTVAIRELSRFDTLDAAELLGWALDELHPRIAIATSFQAESMVLIDLATRLRPDVRVFTIDTGRLPEETHALIDEVRGRYRIDVEVLVPDAARVQAMLRQHGANPFYRHHTLRMLCCHIRKVEPLRRVLAGLDGWITGVRRSQGATRAAVGKVEVDGAHGGILKVNPLADWSRDEVWEHIRANRVPYNALYDRGFTSIGCAPCTRPVAPGEDERAGRWWWEGDVAKECGLHGAVPSERFEQELAWIDQATR